ncbi:hypothetical protein ACEUCP_21275, partial [Aeromonas caviae]
SSMSDKWAKKSITGSSNKMRTPDQIAEKSESSIKSQGMIPPWHEATPKKMPFGLLIHMPDVTH